MSFTTQQVAVGTTQVALTTNIRSDVTMVNQGTGDVFIGLTGVTTTTGFKLTPGAGVSLDMLAGQGVLYGISAAGTNSVHVIQVLQHQGDA